MIMRELTEAEAMQEMKAAGLAHHKAALPYRGYAVTLSDDGKRQRFIGHHPDGRYLLQEKPSDITPIAESPSLTFHPANADWKARVEQLETQGCTRSDAQGIADSEWQRNRRFGA